MPARLTIDHVKKYVYERTNGECEVISNEYINARTPIKIRCSCGNEFKKRFDKIRIQDIRCKDCVNKERSEKYRLDMIEVIKNINITGCEYISGKYENETSILKIKCRCGKEFYKSYNKFMNGQDRCSDCGKEINTEKRTKYTAEYVQKVVNEERGYNIEIDKYISSYKPVPCICNLGHKFDLTFSWYISEGAGCPECARLNRIGQNNANWNGGQSEVIDSIRGSIADWKKEVMKLYNYKCAISHVNNQQLKIHHLLALSSIVQNVSKELDIPILNKICDYENVDDFYKLKEEVIRRHRVENGIVLDEEIHKKFHNLYGYGYNTPEQFNDFLITYYNKTLDEIINEYKMINTPDKEVA